MSAELIGILGVGVALAGLILTGQARLHKRIDELVARLAAVESCMGALEQRIARLEGVLEGAGLFRPAEAPQPSAGD